MYLSKTSLFYNYFIGSIIFTNKKSKFKIFGKYFITLSGSVIIIANIGIEPIPIISITVANNKINRMINWIVIFIFRMNNNINFLNYNLTANADRILLNLLNGDVNIKMFDKENKVQIIKKWNQFRATDLVSLP